MDRTATIVAPASGQGKAGVAVIRISGPATQSILSAVAGGAPAPRVATLRRLTDPRDGETIDRGIVLWFPAPASFTGEDMAELHVHGGRSVVAAALSALIASGCRMAEPGEFARRAFANGKLDLAAVEGLADLVDAETDIQRRQALRQLEGRLGKQIGIWSQELLEVLAWAEAALDFSDEGDVPARSLASAMAPARRVAGEIEDALAGAKQGERLRDGFFVAIAGAPNAGKSTLLNALAQRDVAIVSPIAGTTRDAIEARLDLAGLPVTLVDLAGIRDSSDPIELEGIARAKRHIDGADLTLWLFAVDTPAVAYPESSPRTIFVRSKSDLRPANDSGPEFRKDFVNLSATTGEGVPELLALLTERAQSALGAGEALITRERHRAALADAAGHLRRALNAFEQESGDELVAEDLRLALRAMGRITGRVDVEDVLGAIFARFCIGK